MLRLHVPVAIRGNFAGTAQLFQQSLANQPILIGAALLAVSRHPALSVLAVAWIGAALAGIFPTALGIVGARYPAFTGTVFGLLLTAALTGGMLLPWLTGLVGETHGLRPALVVVALQFLAIAALAALAGRRPAGGSAFARHSGFGSGGGPSGM